ncbi:MAG: hypothetical protein U0838_13315 [Chloroflexota bacterium]
MDYDDRGLAAMPKLVGGPRYTRPPVSGLPSTQRPPDPDDLPLVAARTEEDEALARELGLDAAGMTGSTGTAGFAAAVAVTQAPAPAAAHTGAVATAEAPDTTGTAAAHPNGSWSISSGSAPASSSSRRGFGGLFRGRNGRSGA